MPDFLVSFDPSTDANCLLDLLGQPYGGAAPAGTAVHFPWGAAAILKDGIARDKNIIEAGGNLFGWVGDLLVPPLKDHPKQFLERARSLSSSGGIQPKDIVGAFRGTGLGEVLNGAYALVAVANDFVMVATDPMASVQVYVARASNGRISAIGTHPDLVARLAGGDYDVDPVSVADFLNNGIPCCPYTMHRSVRELAPGTVLAVAVDAGRVQTEEENVHWSPPAAEAPETDERELIEEFRKNWIRAVHDRCDGEFIGAQLSGGLDSRLVLAAIPPSKRCVTLTLCDTINREARIARQVAAAHGRDWVTLDREKEYLGLTALPNTRFTGCEGEWHHGHSVLFKQKLLDMGVDTVFTGLFMDNNFKGYYGRDIARVPRLMGLLPPVYRARSVDYANEISSFTREQIVASCVEGSIERRREFAAKHPAQNRWSACEWLDALPISQSCDNTGWVVERRVFPLKIPVLDRRLVDLAFRVPIDMKMKGFFERAIVPLLGPSQSIINANNGVRPGAGHFRKLVQRAARKAANSRRQAMRALGMAQPVPHSWHDFPHYLANSKVLREIRLQHGERLTELAGDVFSSDPVALLTSPRVPWGVGYRLIQLALWRATIDDYQLRSAPELASR